MTPETRAVGDWRPVFLRCGIGHVYRGQTQKAQRQYADGDGGLFWGDPFDVFDPDKCMVCGLKTWAIDAHD